jgi:hypothetical protein
MTIGSGGSEIVDGEERTHQQIKLLCSVNPPPISRGWTVFWSELHYTSHYHYHLNLDQLIIK